jgi:hypothetical protein
VVDTFCAFGLQIQEAETKTETETYADTTSQKIVAVVESTLQPLLFSITNMYRQE